MSRFVVTELVGHRSMQVGNHSQQPGLSCQVVDTLCNHLLVVSYRTEDLRGPLHGQRWRQARVRKLAARKAAELNARLA